MVNLAAHLDKTPFYDFYPRRAVFPAGGFAGWNLPLWFPAGHCQEHMTVRKKVGVFDVSHMGRFKFYGEAWSYLQHLTTNDVLALEVGQAQYTLLLNEGGGIIDDAYCYRLPKEEFLLVVNAGNAQRVWEHINRNRPNFTGRGEVADLSRKYGQLAVQGPRAIETINRLLNEENQLGEGFERNTTVCHRMQEVGPPLFISNTGYTGAPGVELYFQSHYARKVWKDLFTAGEEFGIKPIGLAARDSLRLEAGYLLSGQDMTEENTPFQAGLGWMVKMSKGDFIGKAALENLQGKGQPNIQLIKFMMDDRDPQDGNSLSAIPRNADVIQNLSGEGIGTVTSGGVPFALGGRFGIGMGYVRSQFSQVGSEVQILIRGKEPKKAQVVSEFLTPEQLLGAA